jgi:hypothetical protein
MVKRDKPTGGTLPLNDDDRPIGRPVVSELAQTQEKR